jgi:hypothetical protein
MFTVCETEYSQGSKSIIFTFQTSKNKLPENDAESDSSAMCNMPIFFSFFLLGTLLKRHGHP